jgi:cell wall-associated NlpC family hydrolase
MPNARPVKTVHFRINPSQINNLAAAFDNYSQVKPLEWLVMLKRTLLILCCVASAHAAPTNNAADDIERYLAERGIVAQMDQVRQSVGDTASDLVGNAMTFLGVPYRRGGTSAASGFDCSGFVRSMFEQTVGKVLPRRASEQAAVTEKIDKQDLKPGDLVFFNTMRQTFSHVGIYVGDNKFIHSPRSGKSVRVEDMRDAYW